jgi:hypothetical protein
MSEPTPVAESDACPKAILHGTGPHNCEACDWQATPCPDKACGSLNPQGCRYPGWRMCAHRPRTGPEVVVDDA